MNMPGEVCDQGRSEKKRSRAQEKQPLEKSLQQPLAMPPTRHKTAEDQAREDAAPGRAGTDTIEFQQSTSMSKHFPLSKNRYLALWSHQPDMLCAHQNHTFRKLLA